VPVVAEALKEGIPLEVVRRRRGSVTKRADQRRRLLPVNCEWQARHATRDKSYKLTTFHRLRCLNIFGFERKRFMTQVQTVNVRSGVKTGKAQCEQMFSGLPQKRTSAERSAGSAFIPNRTSCGRPLCADTVEEVENRMTPKISQILILGQLRRWDAPWRQYEGSWSFF
jgi:hypothetical protein